ncbi:MAG: NDP-sugar synthase [Candidatus Thermoplasmatota archaeon]|nr:NDP-sugar synthase [Candidatus Thermoplasmatota archaeon]
MQAIILSGGYGTRLKPITYTRQKSLLPILNKPMVAHIIEKLPHEVNRVVLAANYRSDQLEEYFKNNDFGMDIIVSMEDTPLGTAGAVKNASQYIDDTFFVLNSDIISSIDLQALLDFHRETKGLGTISLWPVENVSEFGVVALEDDGKITKFVEKPKKEDAPSNLINAGAYCLEQEVLDYIEKGKMVSMEKEIFPRIIADDKGFHGLQFEGYWMDVGRPSSYIDAHKMLMDKKGVKMWQGEHCILSGRFIYSCIGNKAIIGSSDLVDTIVYDEVTIGDDCRITSSIIGANCKIGADCVIENCVIGDREIIKPGTRLRDESVWTKPLPEGYPHQQIGNAVQK